MAAGNGGVVYRDEIGWPEFAHQTAQAWKCLPARQRRHGAILAENYGEASSGRHLLTRQLGERPVWSKRGGYVLFTGDRIYFVRRDGSGLRSIQVTGEPFLADWTR